MTAQWVDEFDQAIWGASWELDNRINQVQKKHSCKRYFSAFHLVSYFKQRIEEIGTIQLRLRSIRENSQDPWHAMTIDKFADHYKRIHRNYINALELIDPTC